MVMWLLSNSSVAKFYAEIVIIRLIELPSDRMMSWSNRLCLYRWRYYGTLRKTIKLSLNWALRGIQRPVVALIEGIDLIKPLSTVLSSAVIKSRQHQEKNAENRTGAAGCKARTLSIVLCDHLLSLNLASRGLRWFNVKKMRKFDSFPQKQQNLAHFF